MHDYKKQYNEWRRGRRDIFDDPAEAGVETDLRVGDLVTFTNDYGATFGPREVLGFCSPILRRRCVYIGSDSWWFPVRLESLKLYTK